MGFIGGCCSAWLQLSRKDPDLLSARALRAVEALASKVKAFPLHDPSDETIDVSSLSLGHCTR